MVLWLGGFVYHHAVKNFLAPCEPDGLEIAHLQILPSSPPSRGGRWDTRARKHNDHMEGLTVPLLAKLA
jgi:hypothetical protein